VITVAALARLSLVYGWPPSSLGTQSADRVFDLVAHHPVFMAPWILGEVKKSMKELHNPRDDITILANGNADDAAKVWNSMKGKSVTIPDTLVIESSPTVLKVAVSDDAVQGKTADFTFNMAPPEEAGKTAAATAAAKKTADEIAAATAVGQKVTLSGTFDSYTTKPLMILMSNGAVVLPKKTAKPTPAHHPAAAHRPTH